MNVKRLTSVVIMRLASTQLALIIVSVIVDLDWNLASPTSLGLVSNVKVRTITLQEYFYYLLFTMFVRNFFGKELWKSMFSFLVLFCLMFWGGFLHHMYESVAHHFCNECSCRPRYICFPLGTDWQTYLSPPDLFPFQTCVQLTKQFAGMEPATLELMVICVNATKVSQTMATNWPNA